MAHKPTRPRLSPQYPEPSCRLPIPGPGQPSSYRPEIGAEICRRIMEGETLTAVCKDLGIATSTPLMWITREVDPGFCEAYRLAREAQAELLVDELRVIADTPAPGIITRTKVKPGKMEVHEDGSTSCEPITETTTEIGEDNVERSKLRCGQRQWLAGVFNPKRFGPKQQIDFNANLAVTVVDQLREARERIANARASIRVVDRCSEELGAIDVTPASSNTLVADSQPGQALDIIED